MSFGPRMRFMVDELQIELAPLNKEVMDQFISPGMQLFSVTRYLGRRAAPVLEDELEWFDKVRTDTSRLIWGIWLVEGEERTLIGESSLIDITQDHIRQATSGSLIFRQENWGQGIASAAHKARTWYAFKHLGLHRIMSAVIQGNGGSLKALKRSGYTLVYVERNTTFGDGALRHQDNLECLNPLESFWDQWWHRDKPTKKALEARVLTQAVMDWAETNVTLL